MCNNLDLLEEKIKEIANNEINKKVRIKTNIKNDKLTYKKLFYSNKKECVSIQILKRYIANKDLFIGVNKKDIKLTKNVLEFIKNNDLIIKCDKII